MDDVLLVRGSHGIRDGDHDLESLLGGEAARTATEILLEILTGEELLDDERRAVVVTRDIEHVDDVAVAHRCSGARLAEEPHHVVLVARVLLVQDLDGDLATERDVGRAVHLTHPADAEAFLEQVLAAEEIPLPRARFFRRLASHFGTRL